MGNLKNMIPLLNIGEHNEKVMAVGVFDLLHAGHLHYLEQAKALGDHLTVVVAHDDTVRKRKHEPVTNQDLRRRMVEGLKPVDVACIGNSPTFLFLISCLRFNRLSSPWDTIRNMLKIEFELHWKNAVTARLKLSELKV